MNTFFLKSTRLAALIGVMAYSGATVAQQLDPQVAAIQVSPNSFAVGAVSTATVNFNVGGSGTPPPAAAPGTVLLKISFPSSFKPVPEGAPSITLSNANLTCAYDQAQNAVNCSNLAALSPGDNTIIDIQVGGYTVNSAAPLNANITYTAGATPINDNVNNNTLSTTANVTAGPSPVSLISFNATKEAQTAVLSWSTAEEINSDRFEVEHSLNGRNWRMIGSVAARGNSKNTQWYAFTDSNPANGSNLYRLRTVDRDGSFDITRAKSLEFDMAIETALYPNPVAERLLLKTDDLGRVRRVELYNASGKSVLESDSVTASGIDVRGLPAGFYVVKVTRANGSTDTFKVLKQ